MSDNPRITIVIPTYNGAQNLFNTLSSVRSQTFRDWRAVIVVDGSTDETITKFQESVFSGDARFTLISQKNAGVSTARNTGLDLCESDYVAFLDHDDVWHPTKLEKQFRFLENNASCGGCTCWYLISQEGPEGYIHRRLVAYQSVDIAMKKWVSFDGNGLLIPSTLMIRREVLRFHFAEDLNAIGDLEFMTRVLQSSQIAVIHSPLVLYMQHRNQMHMSGNSIKDYVDFYSNIHEYTVRQFGLNRKRLNARVNAHLNLIQAMNSFSQDPSFRTCIRLFFSRKMWNLTFLVLIISMIRKRVFGYFARVRYGGMIKVLWNT